MRSKLTERAVRAKRLGYQVTEDGGVLKPDGERLKCHPHSNGYLKFSLPREAGDSDRTVFTHQLAALQWYGKAAFQPGIQVRHLDNNPTNNAKSNLSLGTNSINQMDIDPIKRRERATKASKAATKKTRKFSVGEVRLIRQEHAEGTSIKELARRLVVSTATISYIVNRKTYTDIS